MKILAPGKLILSGEHAVVYGQPALAMAVNRYASAIITKEVSPRIAFDFLDLAYSRRLSFSTLRRMKDKVKKKYNQFKQGDFSIREVLQKPFELAQFAFGLFFEKLNITLPHGVKIQVQSDIPIGCGMGSSAATIVSVIYAVAHHLNLDLSTETLFHLALAAENVQHGNSSGLDLRVSLNGGCLFVDGGTVSPRVLPSFPLYLINTGIPQTSTGQCVEKVATYFQAGSLADDFGAVTRALDAAIQAQNLLQIRQAIQQNHQLLTQIGVVPEKVQRFIAEVEKNSGAAKICGAGAIAGDNAGIVLVSTEDSAQLIQTCAQYQYELMPILPEAKGVHIRSIF